MTTRTFILSALITTGLMTPASAQVTLRLPSHRLVADQAAAQAPLPLPAAPGDGRPHVALTLEDAVKRALDSNLDIAVERIGQQTYDVSLASLRSAYSPVVNSTISTQTAKNASTSTIAGAATGATISNSTVVFNGSLSQNVNWGGGGFSATLNNARQTTTSLNATINPQYSPTWSAQYSQPLLRNFKIDSNRQQLLVTRINQDISDIQLQQTTINTVANVRNAYWDYVFAVQSVEVARQSLNLAEELLRNNQTKVEIGTMAPIDVVQAQSQAAQQRQSLVAADGSRRTAEIALKRLIVSGTSDPLWTSAIDPIDRPDFRPEPIDLAAATGRALASRTDVLQAKKNLEANSVTLKFLENQKLPQADLQARYATSGIGGTRYVTAGTGVNRGDVLEVIPGGYFDALGTLFRQQLPAWSFALNISYPLGMSAADASVARARIQQNQIEVQLRQLDLQVTSDVSNAAVQMQNSAERVQAAQAARDLAQQQLDAENSKFSVGMSTNYQVVQAQRDLATAQNNELQAILAYRRAVVEFERLQQTGSGGNITVISQMSTRWLVFAALMTAGLPAGAVQNAPADPISIDAVITDGQARPVRDLRPSDFELIDAGEPRPVENVRLQSGGSRLLAIFLDEFHVQPGENTLRARRALARFVDTGLRADDTVAIMRPLDPLNAIQLTQDRDAMHRAIESFDGRKGDYAPRTAFEENFMSRAPKEADAARAQVVTAALQALALRLGESRDGRKAIVLISEGFPSALPLAMVYAANRYGVSIYPISPGMDDSSMLRTLAEQTGGNFSVNQPDLETVLARVVADLDAYYVVAYHATQSGDGKYHPVQLRVKRADANVKIRSGYWATNAALLPPATGLAPTAGRIPVRPPHSSPYIRPWIGMSRGPGGATTVTVVWEPGLTPPRNQHVVSVVLTARAEDGRVLFQNQVRAAEIDETGVVIKRAERATFDAPPGYVSFEMAVHNGGAVPLDNDYRGIPVPDLRVTRPTFATPQIVRTRGARAFAGASTDADAVPAATRTFSRSERLLVRIPVYGADGTTPDVTTTLLNRRGLPMRQLDRVPASLPPGIAQFDLSLASLAPDEYRIEFVAANGSGPRDEAKETLVFHVTN